MKKVNKDAFGKDLTKQLNQMSSNAYIDFKTAFLHTLDMHAQEKKKSQRANSKPYVSNAMRIAILVRSE